MRLSQVLDGIIRSFTDSLRIRLVENFADVTMIRAS